MSIVYFVWLVSNSSIPMCGIVAMPSYENIFAKVNFVRIFAFPKVYQGRLYVADAYATERGNVGATSAL